MNYRLKAVIAKLARYADEAVDRLDDLWMAFTAVLLRLMPWLLIGYAVLVAVAIYQSNHWPFSLRADTRLVEVDLDGRTITQWDISRATLCVRNPLAAVPPVYRRIHNDNVSTQRCGSRRWGAYIPVETGGFAPELTANIGGRDRSADHGPTARFSSLPGGFVILHIGWPASAAKTALSIRSAQRTWATLESDIMFVWPTELAAASFVFPFTGGLRVGQDVTSSRRALLENGRIAVYSASGEHAGGRSLVDAIDLLPGDHIEIRAGQRSSGSRGFIRLSGEEMTKRWPIMTVVAFGLSNHVHIRRYGDAGLDFHPSIWARLTHDSAIVIVSLLLFGGLSILATLAEAVRLVRRRRRTDDGPTSHDDK